MITDITDTDITDITDDITAKELNKFPSNIACYCT